MSYTPSVTTGGSGRLVGLCEIDPNIACTTSPSALTGFLSPGVDGVTIVGGELSFADDPNGYLLDITVWIQSQADVAGEALAETSGSAPWGVTCYGQMPAGSGKSLTLHWSDAVTAGSSGVASIKVAGDVNWNVVQAIVRVTKL